MGKMNDEMQKLWVRRKCFKNYNKSRIEHKNNFLLENSAKNALINCICNEKKGTMSCVMVCTLEMFCLHFKK
jgi:hypothetical protein